MAPEQLLQKMPVQEGTNPPVLESPAYAEPIPQEPGRLVRLFRRIASPHFGFALLGTFAAILSLASTLQACYTAGLAHDLVYRAWWFQLFLGIAALHGLAAMARRYPWHRKDTGFLLAYAGLAAILSGTLLTNWLGIEGQVSLIDSAEPGIQQSFKTAHRADTVDLAGRHQVEIFRVPAQPTPGNPSLQTLMRVLDGNLDMVPENKKSLAGMWWSLDVAPGILPWHDDDRLTADIPLPVRLLQKAAKPSPGTSLNLGGGLTLKVENFYPHAEEWPYSASEDADAFAALRLRWLDSSKGPSEQWLTSLPGAPREPGPLAFELMRLEEPALLSEFTNPPRSGSLGKHGELVLALGGKGLICRLAIDAMKPGVPVELAGTPLKVSLKAVGDLLDLLDGKQSAKMPEWPAVHFELQGPHAKGEYLACARLPQMPAHFRGENVARVSTWYHLADQRHGATGKLGSLQFLHGPDDTKYFRVFGPDGWQAPAQVMDFADPEKEYIASLGGAEKKFQVTAWLPLASRKAGFVPKDNPPGTEPTDPSVPALRCTLHSAGQSEEFWVGLGGRPRKIRLGDSLYFARYRPARHKLPFALTLVEIPPAIDKTPQASGSGASELILGEPTETGEAATPFSLAGQRAFNHGAFKVVRSRYQPLMERSGSQVVLDARSRPVNLATLTVTHQPGLLGQYAGGILIVLGLAWMAWPKRHLFRAAPDIAR